MATELVRKAGCPTSGRTPYVSQPLDKVDAAQTPLPEYVACMRRAHSALAGSRQMWLRRKWMESRSTAAQTVAKEGAWNALGGVVLRAVGGVRCVCAVSVKDYG